MSKSKEQLQRSIVDIIGKDNPNPSNMEQVQLGILTELYAVLNNGRVSSLNDLYRPIHKLVVLSKEAISRVVEMPGDIDNVVKGRTAPGGEDPGHEVVGHY